MDGDEGKPGARGGLTKLMSFDDGDSHHDADQAMMMNLGGEVRGMAKLNRAFFTPQACPHLATDPRRTPASPLLKPSYVVIAVFASFWGVCVIIAPSLGCWTCVCVQETADRLKFLPILKTTLAQVDGTLTADTKAKRKGFDGNKNKRKEDYLYDFGMHFYQVSIIR